jgi:hypothetical protein
MTPGWLYHAEQARKAAEQLTDRDAKEVMLQLGQWYLRLAQTAFVQARAREGEFALPLSPGRCNAATPAFPGADDI